MQRLLYISEKPCAHDRRFLGHFQSNGFEVFYASLYEEAGLDWMPDMQRFPRVLKKGSLISLINYIYELRRFVNRHRIDLLHVGPLHTAGFFVWLSGIKNYVAVSWGFDLLGRQANNWLRRNIMRSVIKRACCVLVDCEFARKKVMAMHVNKHIIKMPWGLEFDKNHYAKDRSLRRLFGWSDDEIVVLSNRQWSDLYHVDMIIDAFAQLKRTHPRLRLCLVGGGPQQKILMRQIERYQLKDCVDVLGFLNTESLNRVYAASDIYVSAAEVDGSSISLLEAMAYQLRIVVSNFPSNQEWLQYYSNGSTFKNHSLHALIQALETHVQALQKGDISLSNTDFLQKYANFKANMHMLCQRYRDIMSTSHGVCLDV